MSSIQYKQNGFHGDYWLFGINLYVAQQLFILIDFFCGRNLDTSYK